MVKIPEFGPRGFSCVVVTNMEFVAAATSDPEKRKDPAAEARRVLERTEKEKREEERRSLLREHDLRGVRLGAGGGVLVDDARLYGLVHRRGVGAGGGLGGSGIATLLGGLELLVQSLELSLDALVTGGEANGFTRSFDGRFRVGHGR